MSTAIGKYSGGDDDHQHLAAALAELVVDRRHPDVAALARGVADADEGHQHDQELVELFREVNALGEDEAADHVGDRVGRHQDHARRQDERLETRDRSVESGKNTHGPDALLAVSAAPGGRSAPSMAWCAYHVNWR
jgi:hypothetical protein